MIVRGIKVGDQDTLEGVGQQGVDHRPRSTYIPVKETRLRTGDGPDKPRDAIFSPPGLVGMNDRTPSDRRLNRLVGWRAPLRHLVQHPDDAAMAHAQPVLPPQPLP